MMRTLKADKRLAVLHMLVERHSIRSTERNAKVHRIPARATRREERINPEPARICE